MIDRLRLPLLLLLCCSCDPISGDDARWSVVFSELDGALLSVWGTGPDDVWTVGSDAGDGPYVLHWDGTRWERISTGVSVDLWWVHAGVERVWMCGDDGVVLRYDRTRGELETVDTPTDLRLFGVYEVAPDEVWAVGGDPSQQVGVVLRHDGSAFVEVELPSEAAEGSFFKVWGPAPDDLWIVGHGGRALHWDGQALSARDVPMGRPLLTVHGAGADVVAVGGFGTGLLVQIEDGQLVDRTPPAAPQLNGVFVAGEHAWAAGNQGALLERTAEGWATRDDAPRLAQDYHAVYADPEGGVWAVGGNIVAPPYHRGVLTYFGRDEIEGDWVP